MTASQVGVYFEPTNFRVVDCPNCGMDAVAFDLAAITLVNGVPQDVAGPGADEYPHGECNACGWSGRVDDGEALP